jgi:predicted PurR-regulated permease PerM
VVFTYLAGKLVYRLRDVILLMVVAGFIALILNPFVVYVQRWVPRRGRPWPSSRCVRSCSSQRW